MGKSRWQRPKDCPYIGKGGLKLAFALEHFSIDVTGAMAADLGCHIGGFTDCLLQHGASQVSAVDTGYGVVDWKLRNDPRVRVFERTNALHWETADRFSVVVNDLGWTGQARLLPVVARLLNPGGIAISLVKPQYEAPEEQLQKGVLPLEFIPAVMDKARAACPPELEVLGEVTSPWIGTGGNTECWLYLRRREYGA